jgi:hypothetical protein
LVVSPPCSEHNFESQFAKVTDIAGAPTPIDFVDRKRDSSFTEVAIAYGTAHITDENFAFAGKPNSNRTKWFDQSAIIMAIVTTHTGLTTANSAGAS